MFWNGLDSTFLFLLAVGVLSAVGGIAYAIYIYFNNRINDLENRPISTGTKQEDIDAINDSLTVLNTQISNNTENISNNTTHLTTLQNQVNQIVTVPPSAAAKRAATIWITNPNEGINVTGLAYNHPTPPVYVIVNHSIDYYRLDSIVNNPASSSVVYTVAPTDTSFIKIENVSAYAVSLQIIYSVGMFSNAPANVEINPGEFVARQDEVLSASMFINDGVNPSTLINGSELINYNTTNPYNSEDFTCIPFMLTIPASTTYDLECYVRLLQHPNVTTGINISTLNIQIIEI